MTEQPAIPTDPSRAARRDRIGALCVALAALAMGLPTIRGGFVGGDDHRLALNHVYVNHPSLEHTVKLFTTFHRDLYQPLPLLSFQTEFALTKVVGLYDQGPDAFAWLFHLDNALLHLVNCLLVYLLLLRLQRRLSEPPGGRGPPSFDLERAGASGHATWNVAALAALLFAVHPLQTEVVAWLNGRMFLMSTLFGLGSFLAFTSLLEETDAGPRRGGGRATWIALVTCLLLLASALSKVRAGFVILFLLLWLVYRRPMRMKVVATWFACAAVTGVFIWVNIEATSEAELFSLGAEHLRGPRLVRVLMALAWYFQHYVWPVGLASYYPTPPIVSWSDSGTLVAGITVAAGLIVMLLAARRSPAARYGIVWFFAAIIDTLPFVPARNILAADRYMYVPIIGLLWPTAEFLCRSVATWRARSHGRAAWHVPRAAVAALCGAFIGMCWHVASFYETSIKKTGRVAALYPGVPRVAEKLGWAYYKQGDYQAAITQAHKEFQFDDVPEVISGAHQLMGMAEFELGNHKKALALLHKALEIDPDSSIGKYRLAHALDELGRYEEAKRYYEEAVAAAPAHNPTIHRLAALHRRLGRTDEARTLYEQELRNNVYEVPATMGLVELDLERGTPEALQDAERRLVELLGWMPENLDAWVNLAATYAAQGRTQEAVGIYTRVLTRNPQHQTAALNLAQIYYAAGDLDRAAPLFEAALRGPRSAQIEKAAQEFELVHDVYRCLLGQRYAEATARAGKLCELGPAGEDSRARLLAILEQYDQQRPNDPWTYCLVAQLTLADGRTEATGSAIDLCAQLCSEEGCRLRVGELREQLAEFTVRQADRAALPQGSE